MQPFLTMDAEQALEVYLAAFAPHEGMQPPVAEPTAYLDQLFQPLAQRQGILSDDLMAHGHPARAEYLARPPLAHPIALRIMRDRLPLRSRHHRLRYFEAETSSMTSASNFFSLPSLSLSAFIRLASLTSMPPYLALHVQSIGSPTPCLRHRSATKI